MNQKYLPPFLQLEIIRSRDPAVIDSADIVVDVGGTYEPEKNRFDHHQRGFEEKFSVNSTMLGCLFFLVLTSSSSKLAASSCYKAFFSRVDLQAFWQKSRLPTSCQRV